MINRSNLEFSPKGNLSYFGTKIKNLRGKENSSSFYPQANGQVEAVDMKIVLKHTINASPSNWHIMLYPALWAYQTNVKTATGFSPFQLVHGVEAVTRVKCKILSLKMEFRIQPRLLLPARE